MKIGNYLVNGQDALADGKKHFAGQHVALPSAMLKEGQMNTVEMLFLNKYKKDGEGLHSFIDKEDNR